MISIKRNAVSQPGIVQLPEMTRHIPVACRMRKTDSVSSLTSSREDHLKRDAVCS